jgi:AcrR family transcriptional regulator
VRAVAKETGGTVKKGRVTEKPSKWVPFEDPLATLPETAQKILAAASRLLAERGYQAVTLENVAGEAGVNKASIRYNFGNKAGLLAAVVDALIHDECLRIAADVRSVSEQDRLHVAMVGIQGMIVSADMFRGFFDILPHAFRDGDLRDRLFELYKWWYHQNLLWLGLASQTGEQHDELLIGLAELIAAIPDGLSVQAGLDPEHFDLRRPLAALEFLLASAMDRLVELAGEDGADISS